MDTTYLCKGLLQLLKEIDREWPKRSKSSDGSIGDASHQARPSGHNRDKYGYVVAMDITHDPDDVNARKLAEALVASRDRRLYYIISNRQIISSQIEPWKWRPYTGANAHDKHVHIELLHDPKIYNDASDWDFERFYKGANPAVSSAPISLKPPLPAGAVKNLQAALNVLGAEPPLVVDGVLGDLTVQEMEDLIRKVKAP